MNVLVTDSIRLRSDLAGGVAAASEYMERYLASKPADLRPDTAAWAVTGGKDGSRLTLTLSDEEVVSTSIVPPDHLFHPVTRDLHILQAYGRFLGVKSDRQMERVSEAIRGLDEVATNAQ